ncbi:hypothetical protein M1466_02520 [Candidatus Dependentiae bacterium]|nr:hypothetical protein [Candidatus Dependentiae bacterium]
MMRKILILAILLLPSLLQAVSIFLCNDTPDSFYILTKGGNQQLPPGGLSFYDIGYGTTNILKSMPPLNQIIQTSLSPDDKTTVAVVDEKNSILFSAQKDNKYFVGSWSIQKKDNNYTLVEVELSVASMPAYRANPLLHQAANDITSDMVGDSFQRWYNPGTEGFENLQKFSQLDRDLLLQFIVSFIQGNNYSNKHALVRAAILLKAASDKPSDSVVAQQLTEKLKINHDDAVQAVVKTTVVFTNPKARQAANDMIDGIWDGTTFLRWYHPGTPGFSNLQSFTQPERDSLLKIIEFIPPQARKITNITAAAAILLKAFSPQITDSALAEQLTETLKINHDDAVKIAVFMDSVVQQIGIDIAQDVHRINWQQRHPGIFPQWYGPGTQNFKSLQSLIQPERDSLVQTLSEQYNTWSYPINYDNRENQRLQRLLEQNRNNAIAITAILLKAFAPVAMDNDPLMQPIIKDIAAGLWDGTFPQWYEPSKEGFKKLKQLSQEERDFLLQYVTKFLEFMPNQGIKNAAAIAAILLQASSLLPISTTNQYLQQAANDIIAGLMDGSFPRWYKPDTQGFTNLKAFMQAERDSLLAAIIKFMPQEANKANKAAIAAILLKASSPQISDSALAQKLTETLKISSSDAEKAVQQIEGK